MKINRGTISGIITLGMSFISCPAIYSQVSPCFPPPSGIVAWYQAENNANDQTANHNDGTLTGSGGYNTGEVGQSFDLPNSSPTSYVHVPASASLNVGTNTGLTVEGWIWPRDLIYQSVCEWNQGSGSGAGPIGTHIEINEFSTGDGTLYGNVVDTSGVSHNFWTTNGVITTNNFQHVAMTYDHASGLAVLYHNGTPVASTNLGTFPPQTSYDLFIGVRPAGFFSPHQFHGRIDEWSVYSRALSDCEIQSIYLVGTGGKCH
jgi:hypothetical protein